MKERITVLLGAGAMVEATGVSTSSITDKIIEASHKYKMNDKTNVSIVEQVQEALCEVYKKQIDSEYSKLPDNDGLNMLINFEDIYHVLEMLLSYNNCMGYKGYTSLVLACTKIAYEFEELNERNIRNLITEITDCINEIIREYDKEFEEKGEEYRLFFQTIEKETGYVFDVFNLNYDTWIEQTLSSYNDGYIDISGYENVMQRFEIKEYMKQDDEHTVSHLHGQICFGNPRFNRKDINNFAFQESHNTLYKYKNYESAKHTRECTAIKRYYNQAGEAIFNENIITGMRKTDKILESPFNAYYNNLMNCLLDNNKLIIIGYGFSDLHINNFFYHYFAAHGDSRKTLMIDFIKEENWNPKSNQGFLSNAQCIFSNLMFGNDHWMAQEVLNQDKSFILAKNKKACMSVSGFKKVCDIEHIEKIIRFLND